MENKNGSRLLKLALRVAWEAGKLAVKVIAHVLGLPVLTVGVVALLMILTLLSMWGALPKEVQAAPERPWYEQAAQAAWKVESADRAEEQHKLTWGILAAVDYMAGQARGEERPKCTADETAKKLAPRFEYRDSTMTITTTTTETVTQADGTKKTVTHTSTETKKVKLLVKADTYRGVYTYTYKWVTLHEGDSTVRKEVQESVSYAPDWTRLMNALKDRGGGEPTVQDAIACYNLGLAFDAGEPTLAWLGDEEDAWMAQAAGRWASDPSLPPPTGRFVWPVEGRVTSSFGTRVHPVYGDTRRHNGIDIAVPQGTPVHASADGIVRFAGQEGGFGLLVVIDHGGGIMTFYGHNSELRVKAGDRVSQGDVIAFAGSTGLSTGPHVHFEIRVNGEPKDPVEVVAGGRDIAPERLAALFQEAADATGLDPKLIEAVAWAESGFDPKCHSDAGAIGLMQLMPETARALGLSDPWDPEQNVLGGARHLKGLVSRFGGDVKLALAAYNAGAGMVEKYHGVPPYPETEAYVTKVMRYWKDS